MKKIITVLFILTISLSLNNNIFAQANSVGLNGSFIYSTIAAAYAAMGGSITSPQLIELSASYTGASEVPPIILGNVTGASPTNTITIRPSAGANGLSLSGSLNDGVIRLNSASFVYIDGRPGGVTSIPANYLKVSNTLGAGTFNSAYAILFAGTTRCKAEFLRGECVLNAAGARGVITIGGSIILANTNGNVIGNNFLKGGQRCIQVGGAAGSVHTADTVRNNDVSDYGALGIFLNFSERLIATNNRVHFTGAFTTVATFLVGIQIQGNFTTVEENEIVGLRSLNANSLLHMANFGANNRITRNSIHDNVSAAVTTNVVSGVQFSGSGRTTFANNKIYNLSSVGTGASIIGINVASNGTATDTLTLSKNELKNYYTTVDSDIYGILVNTRALNIIRIWNNNIRFDSANSGSIGIFGIYTLNNTFDYSVRLDTNSIYIGGNQTAEFTDSTVNSAAIWRDDVNPLSSYAQHHNNAINKRTNSSDSTSFHVGSGMVSVAGTISLNHNNYFGGDPVYGYAAIWGNTLYDNSDLVAYKAAAAPHEALTTFGNVNFLKLTLNFESCPKKSPVIVELRTSTAPYNLVESSPGIAGANSQNVFTFDNPVPGVPYYVVVRSVNMIETWSAITVTFINKGAGYDFTTSINAAFGGNQRLSNGIPSVYQGDANQDDFVNTLDVLLTYNHNANFTTSDSTDYSCDGTTDLTDIIIAQNNNTNFISVEKPTPPDPDSPAAENINLTKISTAKSHRINAVNTSNIHRILSKDVIGNQKVE